MSGKVRYLILSVAALVGVFLAFIVLANISGTAFQEKTGAESVEEAVSNLITEQITFQTAGILGSNDPCLVGISAKPGEKGITYDVYDVALDSEIYPSQQVKIVKITANDYQLISTFSNEESCANRPNSDKTTTIEQLAFIGSFAFDATTNEQLATGFSEEEQFVLGAAEAGITEDSTKEAKAYTQETTTQNQAFDTTQCCSLADPNGGLELDPEGGVNAIF
jgi:hypothetical protein